MRDTWKSRTTFILAAVGSAVGLGNAWRFPGLAAKHGGGAFLLVYIAAMLIIGIPMLMMEISVGRKTRVGTPGAMRAMNKKTEPIGWMGVANGFFIESYYAVVFAWVILMFILSYKFAGFTKTADLAGASNLWADTIQTTWTTEGLGSFSLPVLGCLVIAWAACFYCIRNGTGSVGKVVKYTVSLPIICLLILAIRGLTMEGAWEGIKRLFIPDWTALADSTLWVDAFGQVFYSLSVAMGIMMAYGSFLKDDANIASDALIISICDLGISVLSAIVMFTTMAGTGMLDSMSASGIATAFIIYPQAIVQLTNVPWMNAAFGYIFYFCLITLAIDSHFSIVEGVTTALCDKFALKKRKTLLIISAVSLLLGLVMTTRAGVAILDIADNFLNNYTLVLTGALECVAVAWCFKTSKILTEINRNTREGKFKMPAWWLNISLKFAAPIILAALLVWNLITLFKDQGGAYGGYSITWNIIAGWVIVALVLASGFIIRGIEKAREKKGIVVEQPEWKD